MTQAGQALLDEGLVHHRAGRLEAAEQAYRRILLNDIGHAASLHLIGVIASQRGDPRRAAERMARAIAIDPFNAACHANLGNALRQLGQADAAIVCYRAALDLRPDGPEVHYNLGTVLQQLEQPDAADHALRTALILLPDYPKAEVNRGTGLSRAGRAGAALTAAHRALALAPTLPEAWTLQGIAGRDHGDFEVALHSFRTAIILEPDSGATLTAFGILLQQWDSPARAVPMYQRAVILAGEPVQALNGLGMECQDRGDFDKAADWYCRALVVAPDATAALINLASVSHERGQPALAVVLFRHALSLAPDDVTTRWNAALALLAVGDFTQGWPAFEWRLRRPERQRHFRQPMWSGGEAAPGGTVLVWAEEGYGDTIQFCRYATLLAHRGWRVIAEVPLPLQRLLASVPGIERAGPAVAATTDFDYQCPLLSLPQRFATTLATIPTDVPYLAADPAQAGAWSRRLAPLTGLKVGLVWAGEPRPYDRRAQAVDRRRSLPLTTLRPLLQMAGTCFISLQTGAAAGQVDALPPALRPRDWMGEMTDFADTAALVVNLDLVIAVDTAVAHLAGALAKPVWLLSRFDNCWRWLVDRDDSPWYPTMRIFRQPTAGDWDTVIDRVAAELRRRVDV